MKQLLKMMRYLVFTALMLAAVSVPAAAGKVHPTVYKGIDYSKVYNYTYFVHKYGGLAKKYNHDDERILRYFATTGIARGRRGCSAFSVKSYRYGNPDLRRKFGTDLRQYYLHFIRAGYKKPARVRTATGVTKMVDPLTVFEGTDYREVYDYHYFTKRYPSVIQNVGDDDEDVLRYFVRTGMKKRMTAKNPSVYPKAKPSSAYYQRLFRKTLYPSGSVLPADYVSGGEPTTWNEVILSVISGVKNGGGYYTGGRPTDEYPVTTGQAMYNAFSIKSGRGVIDLSKARPSYCSSAVYMVMLKTLSVWDKNHVISKAAWQNLRPYTIRGLSYPPQNDGDGCWGRANANGPGPAVLVKELGAGKNYYVAAPSEYREADGYWKAWAKAEPGDLMKIFRTKYIGRDERGHMTVYLGHRYALGENGKRDDIIYYWSSQSSTGGYGIASSRASEIFRAVLTKVTKPAAFNNAKNIMPDDTETWLASLLEDHNASSKEMKRHILS